MTNLLEAKEKGVIKAVEKIDQTAIGNFTSYENRK